MSLRYATPAQERRWVEEVLHLHALWHRGPPRHPNPSLRPANPPAFKKDNKKRTKKKKQQQKGQPGRSDDPAAAEIEWPCPPAPAPNPDLAGWGDLAPSPAPPRPPPSAEDQARAAAALAQKHGLRACEEFFSSKKDGSDDEDESEEDAMDEDDGVESGAFRFLLGIFQNDGDLRGYYEKNCEKGEFCCLVCRGIGVKKGRRFPDCVGLVQHCTSISKTKRRGAHRAFAKVVCRVLGWDIKRLPSIVLDLGDPLGKSLAKAANLKEAFRVEDTMGKKEELLKEATDLVKGNSGDQMDCIGIKETIDLPNKEHAGDETEKFVKEVGASVEANNGSLMECTEIREITNLSNMASQSPSHSDSESKDIGWQHGFPLDTKKQKSQCAYCGKQIESGGVTRLKQHLAGCSDVAQCLKAPTDVIVSMLNLLTSGEYKEVQVRTPRQSKKKGQIQESRHIGTQTPSTRDRSESDDIEYPPDIETEEERAQYRQAVLDSRRTQQERVERGWMLAQFVHDDSGSGPGSSAGGYSGASGADDDEFSWTSEEEMTWTSEEEMTWTSEDE